ncbi:hypothetical protein GBAR_LOCUS29556 [Geodia barretti]|uniref:Uncharacterized protein n=1 Tax=Geodia barretti TaxID=519541 RepID=A0AA35TUL7_GEOBA|nr:hypothetical protein GBAR_LOCUS29556 [Geodia barretti]
MRTAYCDGSFDLLLSSAPDTRCLALAQSCSLPHAGDWLNAVPSPSLGLHFMDHWRLWKLSTNNYDQEVQGSNRVDIS